MNQNDFEQFLKKNVSPGKIPAEWEQEILAACRHAQMARGKADLPPAQSAFTRRIVSFLDEWLWPSPKVWAGMAVVWLVILGTNFIFHRDNSRPLTPEEMRQREFFLAQFAQRMNQTPPDNL